MGKQEIEITDPRFLNEWRLVKGAEDMGIREKILSYDSETGNYTRLLVFPPGTKTDEVLKHDFCEEIYVLEGYLKDINKGLTMKEGYYGCRPVGMPHGPYEIPLGCVTLEMRYQDPNKGIDDNCSLMDMDFER